MIPSVGSVVVGFGLLMLVLGFFDKMKKSNSASLNLKF